MCKRKPCRIYDALKTHINHSNSETLRRARSSARPERRSNGRQMPRAAQSSSLVVSAATASILVVLLLVAFFVRVVVGADYFALLVLLGCYLLAAAVFFVIRAVWSRGRQNLRQHLASLGSIRGSIEAFPTLSSGPVGPHRLESMEFRSRATLLAFAATEAGLITVRGHRREFRNQFIPWGSIQSVASRTATAGLRRLPAVVMNSSEAKWTAVPRAPQGAGMAPASPAVTQEFVDTCNELKTTAHD